MKTHPKRPTFVYEPIEETVTQATTVIAVRCESNPHEYVRNVCAWCGKRDPETEQ